MDNYIIEEIQRQFWSLLFQMCQMSAANRRLAEENAQLKAKLEPVENPVVSDG